MVYRAIFPNFMVYRANFPNPNATGCNKKKQKKSLQQNRTIFKLIQDIIRTNVLTEFDEIGL